MDEKTLQEKVREAAERHGVPGVAVGVFSAGVEHYAYAGVTSIDNPLPVDADTLFQFGSTGKTFTATALLRLVDAGKVDLDAPVRRYLPTFRLRDEAAAGSVTVLHLLNHTAGWEGDLMDDTGPGDDALRLYVERMAELQQVSAVGTAFSYNNASLSVAGRIIEVVTGEIYETAMQQLLFEPLGLEHCFFHRDDVMTRRFAVGHNQAPDGTVTVARPWGMPRGNTPAGGIVSNAADLITWARFHMGNGRAPDGARLLSPLLLARMQEPTAEIRGSALGDYVGLSWFLRDIDGARIVGHGGTMIGQHSSFEMVPAADFAVHAMANCGPNGPQFNEEIVRWALESYIGVVWRDPEPVVVGDAVLAEYTGTYETIAAVCQVTAAAGHLVLNVEIRPEIAKQLGEENEEQPAFTLGMLAGGRDEYIVIEGPGKGMRGFFSRGASGTVDGVHVGGRMAKRVIKTDQGNEPALTGS